MNLKIKLLLAVLFSVSTLSAVQIECNRSINRIDGDQTTQVPVLSKYNPDQNGVSVFEYFFDLGFGEKIYFTALTANKKTYLMARLQKEKDGQVIVLDNDRTSEYKLDSSGGIEISLELRNNQLMQALVNSKGANASQLELLTYIDGTYGLDTLVSATVTCEIYGH